MNIVSDFTMTLSNLNKNEIYNALPDHVFTRAETRNRASLVEAVMALPEEDQKAVENAARAKKRRLNGENVNSERMESGAMEGLSHETFFETVPEDVCCERITKFIDSTGNEVLSRAVCAICAGQFFSRELPTHHYRNWPMGNYWNHLFHIRRTYSPTEC